MAEYSDTNYYEVQIDDIAAGGGYGDVQDWLNDLSALGSTALNYAESARSSAESAAASARAAGHIGETIEETVDEWLANHPEATTTVQDGAISYKKITDEKLKLYSPHLSDTAELGDMTVMVFPNGKVIACDTGSPEQEDAIDSFMSLHGLTHIDILITTHFHSDHVGCFQHVAETYCDEETLFFRNIDWDTSQIGYSVLSPAEYENIIRSLGAESAIPYQNQVVDPWENCKLRFLNCDSAFLSGYYSAESDTNSTDYVNPSLNNLSLIVEVTYMNRKILLCGDIEKLGQENNADYIGQVDVFKVPHHNWNMNGYYQFFLNANPKVAFFNRNTEMTFPAQAPHYWDRIQMQMMGERPTYQTLNGDVEIDIDYYSIEVKSGDVFSHFAKCPQDDQRILSSIPNCKSNYNFWAHNTWSIDDVLAMIRESSYLEEALIDLRSTSVMTTFISQLKDVIGTSYDVYSVHPFKSGFELTPTTALDISHRFSYGFVYANTSTHNQYYRKGVFNEPYVRRVNVSNTNILSYATTLPQGIHARLMNNFSGSDFPVTGNAWVVFYVTNSNYIVVECFSISESNSRILRNYRVNGSWGGWKSIQFTAV